MAIKTVCLPQADDMIQRLKAACDEPHLTRGLYPLIVRRLAGKQLSAPGINLQLSVAVIDYTTDFPSHVMIAVEMQLPDLIRAIVDDKDIAEEVVGYQM